jgi:hypothetical protein
LGYIKQTERKKNAKETKVESSYRTRFASVTRKEREALEFQAIGGDKNAWIPRKWEIEKRILVNTRMFFVIYVGCA